MLYKWSHLNHEENIYNVVRRSTGENVNDNCYLSIDTATGEFIRANLDDDGGFQVDPRTGELAVISGVDRDLDVQVVLRGNKGILYVES